MRIKKLTIRNLNSLRLDATIDFLEPPLANTGLFAITGDTGAGKSTILDAITLALYGQVPRNSTPNEVLSYGTTDCLAEVEFEHGGRQFRSRWSLRRSRNKIEGKIQQPVRELATWEEAKGEFITLASGAREVDVQVEAYTGLDYNRFRRSVLLAQGDFAAFLDAEERMRSELLERITGTEIYSGISSAAYRRFKAEEEKLGALVQQLKALRLLPDEEIEALRHNLQQVEEDAAMASEALETIRQQVQAWEAFQKALESQQQLNKDVAQLEEARIGLQESEMQLQRHQMAAPLQRDCAVWEEQKQALNQERIWMETATEQLSVLERAYSAQETQAAKGKTALQALESVWEARQTLWKRVRELDLQIRERSTPLEAIREEAEGLAQEIQALEVQIQNRRVTLQELSTATNSTGQWLQEHEPWKQINAEYAFLDSELQQFLSLRSRFEIAETERKALAGESSLHNRSLQEAEAHWTKEKEEYERLEAEFTLHAPDRYPKSRAALLDHLFQDMEKLSDQEKDLQTFERFEAGYRTLLQERQAFREQLEQLQEEDLRTNAALLTAIEQTDELQQELDYKQHIFEQQQLIANYEKDRANLKEGDPCPLCLSTEHPFRRRPVKPFADKARVEAERVRNALTRAQQTQRDLLTQHREIGQRILELAAKLEDNQKLQEFEEQIAQLWRAGLPGQGSVQNRIKTVKADMQHLRAVRERLSSLHIAIAEAEQRMLAAQESCQQLRMISHTDAERLQNLERKGEELFQEQAAKETSLQEGMKRYGIAFSADTADAAFAELTRKKETYAAQEKQYAETQEQLKLTRLTLDNEEKLAAEKQQKWVQTSQRLHALEAAFLPLRDEREMLLGQEDPDDEERDMRLQLENQTATVEHTRKALEALLLQKKEQEGAIRQGEANLVKLEAEVSKAGTVLRAKATELGFNDLAALLDALLPEDRVRQIQEQQQQQKEQEAALRALQRELEQRLAALQVQIEGIPELPFLLQQRTELESRLRSLQESAGSHKHQLEAQAKVAMEAASLKATMQAQLEELRRWNALNDLIGSADGKKFRVYAQGLTLAQLVMRANGHLSRLSGRYVIRKRDEADLELDIVDTYQANNTRSMKTLSGGERFLVSLALALGLADLASGRTSIQSLFIDEGFGSLDDNSLDLAIGTLENLQSSGKTIGIISHVKELKDRIGVQIQVQKQSSGFSEVRIVG